MKDLTYRALSRRRFLKVAGAGLAAAGAAPFLGGCGPAAAPTTAPTAVPAPTAPPSETLNWWWWGEAEAPGLENWVNKSIELFHADTGHTVEPTLQETDLVIPQFQTASAAGNAPDLQFFWNGIYHMETAWMGYLEPLNGLIEDNLRKNSGHTKLSVYEGKQYRMGWYALPIPWLYNKEIFDKAGLNGDEAPKTWDQFMDACDKIKTAGYIPIVGGGKEGYWGEWWMAHSLIQSLDSFAEALDLFVGDLDWRDPKYVEHWSKLEEIVKAEYINDDMNSVELWPGVEMFGSEQGAITPAMGTLVPSAAELLGAEKVGLMVMPVFGTGALAGKPCFDAQGLGISSQSEHKEVAAEFLSYLHSTERLNSLYETVGILPADETWDSSIVDDPLTLEQIERWVQADNVPWLSNLMPVLFWTDAMFVNQQKIVAGEWNGEQAAENSYEITQKWLEQNPDMVENYKTWKKDLESV